MGKGFVPADRALQASLAFVLASALGCAGQLGESHTWKRPCGTSAQRQADSEVCLTEAAGLADPSGRGAEYAPDLFRQCMETRGWQRVPSSTAVACE